MGLKRDLFRFSEFHECLLQLRRIVKRLGPAAQGVNLHQLAALGLQEMLAVREPGQPGHRRAVQVRRRLLGEELLGRAFLGQRLDAGGRDRRLTDETQDGVVLTLLQAVVEEVPGDEAVVRFRLQERDGEASQRLTRGDEHGPGGDTAALFADSRLHRDQLMILEHLVPTAHLGRAVRLDFQLDVLTQLINLNAVALERVYRLVEACGEEVAARPFHGDGRLRLCDVAQLDLAWLRVLAGAVEAEDLHRGRRGHRAVADDDLRAVRGVLAGLAEQLAHLLPVLRDVLEAGEHKSARRLDAIAVRGVAVRLAEDAKRIPQTEVVRAVPRVRGHRLPAGAVLREVAVEERLVPRPLLQSGGHVGQQHILHHRHKLRVARRVARPLVGERVAVP